MDMDLVVIFSGLVAIVTVIQVGKVLSRRSESRSVGSGDLAEIRQRLETMERAIDTIAIEVERGTEAQRFTVKLLAERPGKLPASPEA